MKDKIINTVAEVRAMARLHQPELSQGDIEEIVARMEDTLQVLMLLLHLKKNPPQPPENYR